KSTLARSLAQTLGAEVIRTDVVRKQLAGIAPELSGKDLPGLYSPEMTTRTYGAMLSQAEEALWQGRRVVVDATFSREEPRREFLNLADRLAVPVGLLLCEAPEGLIRERLASRRGDASDADWEVYRQARDLWEPLSSFSSRRRHTIVTASSPDILVSQCRPILAEWELAESSTAADGE
ncbi:MAG: AAA family ATPase, partial [Planctomycetaceae bacterium]